ncbi:class C sortase [Arcanobacterium haemolyticum]|nr:class C sortase [Arcanobacterium haemolyticum]
MAETTAKRDKKKLASLLFLPYLIVLLVIGGSSLLVYPTAASWLSQFNYSKLLDNYDDVIENVRPDRNEQLVAAHAYNDALTAGAQLLPGANVPEGSGSLSSTIDAEGRAWDYNSILAADQSGLMGRIKIDKIDVDLPIYHGTTEETLLRGAGHLEGTSFPVGGASTHSVITAHRGLASAELFTRLNEITVGDTFVVEVFGEVLTYKVMETKVVEPDDTDGVRAVPGRDLATLVTCTPLGINTHRILVTGERIIPTPAADIENAGKDSELPRFPWWLIAYATAVIGSLVWGWFQTRRALRVLAPQNDDEAADDEAAGDSDASAEIEEHAMDEAATADAGRAVDRAVDDPAATPETAPANLKHKKLPEHFAD